SIAITGSMNQKGMVQPVGGIKEKGEGFFDICKYRDHLGPDTGVIIPYQNIDDLVLKEDLVEAVEKGLFSIYAVKDIDEVIEIATGEKASKVHSKVYKKLKEYFQKVRKEEKKNR
ncbi:MAG: hypothetical protein N2169_04375, partial [bacterium]|nr:hypothetical protein [bacterium]